jgi:hypothetical protein
VSSTDQRRMEDAAAAALARQHAQGQELRQFGQRGGREERGSRPSMAGAAPKA